MVAAVRTEPDTAGARLASARSRLGLSLDQVADHLKLDPHTVLALEKDDHRAIGAAVFVRGFLRRYAALVGESPADMEALYARRPDAETQPDLSRIGMHRIEPAAFRPSLGVKPALIAALALAIAGAGWWAMYSRPPAAGAAASASPLPPAALPLPAAADSALQASGATPAGPTADAKPAALPGRRQLRLSFTGECWAEIYDAHGARLFFGFGHAGTTQELSGVPPFRLVLGNAAALTVALEQHSVALPVAVPGERLRVLLSASGAATAIR